MQAEFSNQYHVPGQQDPIATYENHCLRNPDCGLSAYREMGNDVTLQKNTIAGDILEREILIQPHAGSVPGVLRTLAGDDAFDCVQYTRYDFATHIGTAETVLTGSFLKTKVKNKATFTIRCPNPDTPRTVSYDSACEINVNILFVGKKAEKSIIEEVSSRQPKIRSCNQTWLNNQFITDGEPESETATEVLSPVLEESTTI